MSRAFELLEDEVYPRLDAVSSGLLDNLDPSDIKANNSYLLTCPKCKEEEAFYYTGSKYIQCPRNNNCGHPTSLYDYLINYENYSPTECLEKLFSAAGVILPKLSQKTNDQKYDIYSTFKEITVSCLKNNPQILRSLSEDRSIPLDLLSGVKAGYIPHYKYLLASMAKKEYNHDDLVSAGLAVENPGDIFKSNSSGVDPHTLYLKDTFLLFLEQPNSRLGYCIYKINHKSLNLKRKYIFSPSFSKEIPYLFNDRSCITSPKPIPVCVEGVWDAWAVRWVTGTKGIGIGGAEIIKSQASFFSAKSIAEIIHLVDNDVAGFKGGIKSILNCAVFNIRCHISLLPAHIGDPDDARKNGFNDELIKAVNEPLSPGEFIAKTIEYAGKAGNDSLYKKAISAIPSLMPQDHARCKYILDFSNTPISSEYKAAELLFQLVSHDRTFKDALSQVKKTYPMLET